MSATIALMDRAPGRGVYNIGGGSETTLREIIETCERLSGRKLDATYGEPAAGDVRRTAADCSLIREHVGWQAAASLEEGLQAQLDHVAATPFATLS